MKTHFLIAAPSSNSGKTTIAVGLTKILADKGLTVQTFKCGPDFIDTKLLTTASSSAAINLDAYMMSEEHLRNMYSTYSTVADVTITEGVMGLFDGSDKMKGSSAEIAMLLKLPVILVIDVQAVAYSVAALMYGFKNFRADLNLAGVIYNRVNTESHFSFLKNAAEDVGVCCLGYVPANEEIKMKSRHLGLSTELVDHTIIGKTARHIEKTVAINKLLAICSYTNDQVLPPVSSPFFQRKPVIAIANDVAFNFMYHQNLEILKEKYTLKFFSPLHDNVLPDADIVYLPGGYPELYLEQLSSNYEMKNSLYRYCDNGGKLLAECGGMMYIGNTVQDKHGDLYPMIGFINIETSMATPTLTLGYRKFHYQGKTHKGHEFHYSVLKEFSSLDTIGSTVNAKDQEVSMKVFKIRNVVASYMHFYWGENGELIEDLFQSGHHSQSLI